MTLTNFPKRTLKPRKSGITMVIDNGYGERMLEDYFEIGHAYIDMLKFGWGSALISNNLEKKITLCKKYNIKTYLGGTLFERFLKNNQINEYHNLAKSLKVDIIEISDGTIDIENKEKLEYIKKFKDSFQVVSEIGNKNKGSLIKTEDLYQAKQELIEGAFKIVFEGRESGNVGIFDDKKEIRKKLVDDIYLVLEGYEDSIIWETPLKSQQAWFINYKGNKVNLGNINLQDIISLESLRLGLRSDTFFKFS